MPASNPLTIGEVARRTGIAVSAIRFYADEGLVHPIRSAAGHRYFNRSDIRRVSFILIAQQLGFSLSEIQKALIDLPNNKAPSKRDWDRLAKGFQLTINERIEKLTTMRDSLSACIGCGCLSLKQCRLYNPEAALPLWGFAQTVYGLTEFMQSLHRVISSIGWYK